MAQEELPVQIFGSILEFWDIWSDEKDGSDE
jgi:hypothetical protein